MKRAFTIIEIIISTIIIAIVVMGILKINRENFSMAEYIANRNKSELSNTLFLTKEALKYDKSQKDAYTLLHNMPIKNSKVIEYLKGIKRKIYVDRDIDIGKIEVPIRVDAIMLKSKYSTRYYRINP